MDDTESILEGVVKTRLSICRQLLSELVALPISDTERDDGEEKVFNIVPPASKEQIAPARRLGDTVDPTSPSELDSKDALAWLSHTREENAVGSVKFLSITNSQTRIRVVTLLRPPENARRVSDVEWVPDPELVRDVAVAIQGKFNGYDLWKQPLLADDSAEA